MVSRVVHLDVAVAGVDSQPLLFGEEGVTALILAAGAAGVFSQGLGPPAFGRLHRLHGRHWFHRFHWFLGSIGFMGTARRGGWCPRDCPSGSGLRSRSPIDAKPTRAYSSAYFATAKVSH